MPEQNEIEQHVANAIEAVKNGFMQPALAKKTRIQPRLNRGTNRVTLNDTVRHADPVATYDFRNMFIEIPTGTKKNPRETVTHAYLPALVTTIDGTNDELQAYGLRVEQIGWGRWRTNNNLRLIMVRTAPLPYIGTTPHVFRAETPIRDAYRQAATVYSGEVINAAMREMNLPLSYRIGTYDEKFDKAARTALMTAMLGHMEHTPQQRGAYQDFVKFTGRKPNSTDLHLFLIMRNTLNQLADTPAISGMAFTLMLNRVDSAQKDSTFVEHIRIAAKLKPKRAQELVRKFVDPKGIMLPRHWRAFTKEHPNGFLRYFYRGAYGANTVEYREITAATYRLVKDFWPVKKWPKAKTYANAEVRLGGTEELAQTASILRDFGNQEWPDIAKTYLEAVEKYASNVRKQRPHEPYHNTANRVRLLRVLIENQNEIKMDGDLKRASLKRLYELAKEKGWVTTEPEESLRFGRFRIENFPKGNVPLTRDSVTLVPLRTHVDLYEEGNLMGHCLFTAWTNNVKDGTWFAYRVMDGREHVGTATIAKDRYNGGWSVYQVVGRHNAAMKEPARKIARELALEACKL